MTRHSTGTIRQRRPNVWEVRVCVGADPVSGQPVQRSVTVQGQLAEAAGVAEVAARARVLEVSDAALDAARGVWSVAVRRPG